MNFNSILTIYWNLIVSMYNRDPLFDDTKLATEKIYR